MDGYKRAIVLFAVLLSACSMNRVMVHAEKALLTGSEGWDAYTTSVIEDCRSKTSTEAERAECVAPTRKVDDIVAAAVTAAVAALRAYWLGVSIGEDPKDLRKHVNEFVDAVDDLPIEHFGGLQKLVK